MTTQDRFGQKVRGFKLYILPKTKKKPILTLPCTGFPLLTGIETLRIMKRYKNKGFETIAETEMLGEIEQLTLQEMQEVVI